MGDTTASGRYDGQWAIRRPVGDTQRGGKPASRVYGPCETGTHATPRRHLQTISVAKYPTLYIIIHNTDVHNDDVPEERPVHEKIVREQLCGPPWWAARELTTS